MPISRRTFLGAAAAATVGQTRAASRSAAPMSQSIDQDRFDPWIEVSVGALEHNLNEVRRLSGGRPVLAVVKNNAYGLGLVPTVQHLQPLEGVDGFAVVTSESAVRLRNAGVTAPLLLMGLAVGETARELAVRDVELSVYNDEGVEAARAAARSLGRPVDVQVYFDTGMSRMGLPFRDARARLEKISDDDLLRIRGAYMAFTEESDFDPEQLRRFRELAAEARSTGVELGRLHAASSNGVFHLPDAHLDLVRPGIALYGSYPSRPEEERAKAKLRPAFALKAKVVRVARLEAGDTVSYGRRYRAERPTWVATIPAGHADGYPRRAVDGARVLIGGRLYAVIGAVSASHTIVEVGEEPSVAVGDVATLLGPEPDEVQPNRVAEATGVSVYDLLMHLNPTLPRVFGV